MTTKRAGRSELRFGRRPGAVTAAGIIAVVLGGLNACVALRLIGDATNEAYLDERGVSAWIIVLVGSVALISGCGMVLAAMALGTGNRAGRVVAVALAAINVMLGVRALPGSTLLIGLYALVIILLTAPSSSREFFGRPPPSAPRRADSALSYGWFPDPTRPGVERWWDGNGWTQYQRAFTAASSAPGQPLERHRRAPIALAVTVAAIAGVADTGRRRGCRRRHAVSEFPGVRGRRV